MKSLTEHLWFEVPNRRSYINITHTVEDLVRKSGIKEGLCLVNAMHVTEVGALTKQLRIHRDQTPAVWRNRRSKTVLLL